MTLPHFIVRPACQAGIDLVGVAMARPRHPQNPDLPGDRHRQMPCSRGSFGVDARCRPRETGRNPISRATIAPCGQLRPNFQGLARTGTGFAYPGLYGAARARHPLHTSGDTSEQDFHCFYSLPGHRRNARSERIARDHAFQRHPERVIRGDYISSRTVCSLQPDTGTGRGQRPPMQQSGTAV